MLLGKCTWNCKDIFDRHTGFAMQKPQDADSFHKMSKRQKIEKMLYLSNHFGPYDGFTGKKYILISAMTVPFPISYLSGDLGGLIKSIKTYIKNMKGKIIGRIIYTDSLFKILNNKEIKYIKKAFTIGANL